MHRPGIAMARPSSQTMRRWIVLCIPDETSLLLIIMPNRH